LSWVRDAERPRRAFPRGAWEPDGSGSSPRLARMAHDRHERPRPAPRALLVITHAWYKRVVPRLPLTPNFTTPLWLLTLPPPQSPRTLPPGRTTALATNLPFWRPTVWHKSTDETTGGFTQPPVGARSPDHAPTTDRRSPSCDRETYGRAGWNGRETVPQQVGLRHAARPIRVPHPRGAGSFSDLIWAALRSWGMRGRGNHSLRSPWHGCHAVPS
jgi:hypothetical protein